ncbi:MAG: helix-turn-helix transcriptional regulator [Rhodospirillales bacterium]|nr:helix-turn-helix transcriptional regulator [Rhodospirillales bacterium]
MLKHADVWQAIDSLAREHGFSASGLARRAGLDPTTFNKSKRATREGKLRWPSTESISKILAATGAPLGEFISYIGEEGSSYRNIPVIALAQAGGTGFFDDSGYPTGQSWDEVPFPDLGDPHAFGLEIGDKTMEPVYREGDMIVVSPQATVRRGDRVVVRILDGELIAKQLIRRTANKVELKSLNPLHEDPILANEDVAWIARIVWASQ